MNVDIDRLEQIKKYLKYVLILIPIVVVFFIIKSCGKESYNSLESKVKGSVSNYITDKNLTIMGEQYIELSDLDEIEGLELCSSASGALVENKNGKILITPYLECNGYKSDILKNKGKYIELNGDTIMLLNKGEVFNDPLYTLKRDADVEIDGIVGSTPGVYTIKYNVSFDNELKETLIRKVIVVNSDKTKMISGIESVTDPTLVLYGDTEIVLAKGEKYVEPGYKAVDYVDGKISRQVRVDSKSVNTSATGTYTITYTVENSRGKTAFKIRTVNVVSRKSNISIEVSNTPTSNNSEIIKLMISGPDYAYSYLPDQTKVDSREVTYEAKRNGNYIFRVFDSYGNRYTKEVMIDSVDDVAPSGSCKAIVTSSATNVTVNAIDNKGIGGYNYILNGKGSGYIENSSYYSSGQSDSVKVKIKDISGNEVTVNCEVEKKTLVISGGTCGTSDVLITINTCYGNKLIRKDVPLEEYLIGVLYGEETPGLKDPEAYIKAFIIFARSYTLNRIGYWAHNNKPIKSCSSDQNWCDLDTGCYRDQTQEMFDLCIDYAVNYPRHDYTASTCANRVTTFPGSSNVSNKTFYASNPGWWGEKSVTSTGVRSSWHGPLSEDRKEFYKRMVEETAGLIIYDANGSPASVNYYMCDDTSKDSTMCPNTAEKLAREGYTMEQLIEAYTTKYPGRTVGCFNK